MLGQQRGAVVVVSRVSRLDPRVRLRWQRSDDVREHVIWQPARAVVVGLARPHPVTRNGRVTSSAACALASVIPRRKERAGGAHRQVNLPLRPRGSIGV